MVGGSWCLPEPAHLVGRKIEDRGDICAVYLNLEASLVGDVPPRRDCMNASEDRQLSSLT